MTEAKLKDLINEIVRKAQALKNKYTNELNAPVNYACIFSKTDDEYQKLNKLAHFIGKVIKETKTGLIFHINDLETTAGTLRLLKIRLPDSTRPEKGDADFTVSNYLSFKNKYLGQPGFKLILRPEMEMIELMESNYSVRTYFSNPPLDKQLLDK